MNLRGLFLMTLMVAVSLSLRAQSNDPSSRKAPLNQVDKNGRPHGSWYATQPARMGEPLYTEFGTYEHGRKNGIWYKMDEGGELLAVEGFRNNVLHGNSKYFENGHLAAEGPFRGLNPDQEYDTIWVADPITGFEKQVSVSTERGSLKHGLWRFYDPQSGRLIREAEYQVDDLISEKKFTVTKADSAYYERRNQKLPHVVHPNAKARSGKFSNNIGY